MSKEQEKRIKKLEDRLEQTIERVSKSFEVVLERLHALEERDRDRATEAHNETEAWKKLNEKASRIEDGLIDREEHERDVS